MADCVFCKIVGKEINAEIVYEDQDFIVFKDVKPKADLHLLIIPKKHISSLKDFDDNEAELIGKLILTAKKVAQQFSQSIPGYKLVFNVDKAGGQEVPHVHLHLLAGQKVGLP